MKRTLVIASSPAEQAGDVTPPETAAEGAMSAVTRRHHQLVVEGVRAVWEQWGREVLDLVVMSSSFGLRHAGEFMVPFHDQRPGTAMTGSSSQPRALDLRQKVIARASDCGLVFFLLGGPHLATLSLPLPMPDSVQQIALTDEHGLDVLPAGPGLHVCLADGGLAARRWHVKADHVRGFLFRRLCGQVVRHGPAVLDWLCREPEAVDQLFYKQARWRPQFPLWPSMGD